MISLNNVSAVKSGLRLFKLKAIRTRVWFKALSRLDRALINLTLRVVDKVRSPRLREAISKIIDKIRRFSVSNIFEAVFKVGLPMACKISLFAKKWGNPNAETWMSDLSFAKFLAIMWINNRSKHGSHVEN